jgi:hypothetical protein
VSTWIQPGEIADRTGTSLEVRVPSPNMPIELLPNP